ncbi:MAG TPA: DUF1003 domain-containing protein [Vicinamibacterales bacterium]|nr:DUF1003 domain-containing protein [Vicinamibacterales bacterium]
MTTRHQPLRSRALSEDLATIERLERNERRRRTPLQRISEWITDVASSGPFLVFHAIWFPAWMAVNTGLVPGIDPFDPFPFELLTMVVSLEAIFLTLFVLASQNQLTEEANDRARLDLQIDLMAEREMTAVLRMLRDISTHLGAKTRVSQKEIDDLATKTEIYELALELARERRAAKRHGDAARPRRRPRADDR